jgi:chromosome segregation ATPase
MAKTANETTARLQKKLRLSETACLQAEQAKELAENKLRNAESRTQTVRRQLGEQSRLLLNLKEDNAAKLKKQTSHSKEMEENHFRRLQKLRQQERVVEEQEKQRKLLAEESKSKDVKINDANIIAEQRLRKLKAAEGHVEGLLNQRGQHPSEKKALAESKKDLETAASQLKSLRRLVASQRAQVQDYVAQVQDYEKALQNAKRLLHEAQEECHHCEKHMIMYEQLEERLQDEAFKHDLAADLLHKDHMVTRQKHKTATARIRALENELELIANKSQPAVSQQDRPARRDYFFDRTGENRTQARTGTKRPTSMRTAKSRSPPKRRIASSKTDATKPTHKVRDFSSSSRGRRSDSGDSDNPRRKRQHLEPARTNRRNGKDSDHGSDDEEDDKHVRVTDGAAKWLKWSRGDKDDDDDDDVDVEKNCPDTGRRGR